MAEKKALREAYGEVLAELGAKDSRVVALDADLSGSTKTAVFGKKFPERFFNMGISEQDMMVTACGLAATGKIPFVSSFAVFATGRAWEQMRNSVALTGLNVKIVATHAGITVGEDGKSHQALEDLAITRVLPGMTVIAPADAVETKKAIVAVYEHVGPCYVRLTREKFPVHYDDSYPFKIGRAHRAREGRDVTFVAVGICFHLALEAAELLQKKGVSARVVNMSTVKPLDKGELAAAARETGAVVTVEEHNVIGGLGSAVCEALSSECPVPVERVGMQDEFGMSGNARALLEHYGFTPENLTAAAEKAIKRKQKRA